MYSLLGFSKAPRFIWNKELYLCTRIAWKNHKFFLNRNQKYNLAQKYIAFCYLNKMECDFLDDIKEQIKSADIATKSKSSIFSEKKPTSNPTCTSINFGFLLKLSTYIFFCKVFYVICNLLFIS